MPQYNDSQVLVNWSIDHQVNRRSDKPKEEVCPNMR